MQQLPTPPGVPIPYPNTGTTSAPVHVLFFDEADALFGKRTRVSSFLRRP